MRRALLVCAVLLLTSMGLSAPTSASASVPTRTLTVSGSGVGMFPDFDPAVTRYAATTTAATDGMVQIAATTTDAAGTVTVDGSVVTSPATVSGLTAGDEVSIVIADAAGRTAYSVMYLPGGFPALHVTTDLPGRAEPGLIGLTLNAFDGVQPSFGAIVDRNGVPVYAVDGPWDTDLKQQPNGDITVSRATTAGPGHTGYSLVTLDRTQRRLPEEAKRYDVTGDLTDTDGHDSVRLADGSTILIGYEPRGDCSTGYLDATIQKQDAAGNVVFQWRSNGLEGDALNTIMWPTGSTCQRIDYAHINSVVSVEHGDIIASFRHLSAVYRIATVAHDGYAAGQVIWRLGGRHSDFVFDSADDPYPGGPCAQHAVSQLANGHLLVFDNGTSGFCVDPNNPAGPAISRAATRISEYALDTSVTPHRATLVWSYAPAGKYAMFAGSARRMANGDTLIGWAADRSALATEVDAQGQTVWELKAADPPAGSQRYATYRAELITALRPAAAINGPVNGSTFVQGSVVPASGSCTDWLGHALDACATSGLADGGLDTTSLGQHTWTVTARDGAGNVETKSRTYAVRAARRQPDGLIRKAGSTVWKGGGRYGAATDQAVRQRTRLRHTAVTVWRVRNDGERADGFRLIASRTTRKFAVHYVVGGIDVTPAVVAGTYRTPALEPGQSITVKVTVRPTRRARPGTARTVTMAAAAVTDPTKIDRVAAVVTARR